MVEPFHNGNLKTFVDGGSKLGDFVPHYQL